jgi:hypothetical protein
LKKTQLDFEIIFSENGSTENTFKAEKISLSLKNPEWQGISNNIAN